MLPVVSPEQMRALEARHFQTGAPPIQLMERAATGLVDVIEERLSGCPGHAVCFACGPGNNGGDGYAAARLFADRGGRAIVISAADEARLRGDAQANCRRAHDTPRVFFHDVNALDGLPKPDLWVDALFGTGLNKPLEGVYNRLIRRMALDRANGALVIAVDIPSGVSGQSGEALGEALCADVTVTFEHRKLGHFLLDGVEAAGELHVHPIGIHDTPGDAARLVELDDLQALIKPRRRNSHKGDYGHLLIVAGSRGMAGACVLAATAATRGGAGLVTVACPASLLYIVQIRVPCAMCVPLPEADGALSSEAAPMLKQILPGKAAVAIGPGLSGFASEAVVEAVLTSRLPAVFDADALNLISRSPVLKALLSPHHILTPHPGEAKRLLGRALTDPVSDAQALRALGPVALLKGATSVIAGDRTYLSISGHPGMARGGSGDVLTGLIGALLAQGHPPEQAAYMGSELHGRAGECAAARMGEIAMTAEDIIAEFKEAFRLVW